ncbi:MAG: GGDEF domain-containing protein [Thermoleophilia bacterium]|nr:GGDEF domain-containing protein [Thermoleophilia bacterium]
MTDPPATRRARRPRPRPHPSAEVADPSRGTLVAVGLPLVALVGAIVYSANHNGLFESTLPISLVLVALAAAASQAVVQLGPRSWYTAATPVVVLAGLLGGPLVGVAAGVATQLVRRGAVWRRVGAEGGTAALQGFAAGLVGLVLLGGVDLTGERAATTAAMAMLAAVAVNSVCRFLIILERHPGRLVELWARGIRVDLLETVLVVPLVAVLLITSIVNAALVLAATASLLASLLTAQRSRESTAVALAAEQVNARRDQLTGAPNRRAFEEAMIAEHARVVRGGLPAGLFLIDLDRFKSVNDRFGHKVGDEVLIEVVRRLTDGLRPTDLVARWGGEEITVLAPGVRGRRQLEQFAERIRVLVRELPIATSTTALPVTVSVGGTLLDGSVAPSAALHRADGALYDAKRTRDSVAISLPPRLTLHLESA